ncbi:hypothetical protein HIM_08296 [Hirsutella minnesotensis 3608]|uniref:Serine hydrolase domain-containing protein n=1 Tax=Hirsutella minnesotensis 3608 TaxID=1043627 RepID=A0A0F7ZMP7_9HYPO|nr:hypothetical protein HIM_08296 [Hirsutella minnesotensis 3608]
MRTLMLHGHATSAVIFKAQTGPFRSKLDKTFSFDFVDGPYPCAPPQALKSIISTAYAWTKSPDIDSVHDSVVWLADYMDKNGPYDCICCFSKAAVVVAAMLMDKSNEHLKTPGQPQLKSVIFMNGSIEYSLLEELGLSVSNEARDIKSQTEEQVKSRAAALPNLATAFLRPGARDRHWNDTSKLLHDPDKLPPSSDCFGLDFTALPPQELINIPTVHIVGAKDPIWPSSIQLAHLCDPAKRSFYDHGGGHDLPRMPQVATDIAKVFRELAEMGGG